MMLEKFFDVRRGEKTSMPWTEQGQAIYDFLCEVTECPADLVLPDREKIEAKNGLSWVGGGMDGAFIRHWSNGGDQEAKDRMWSLLKKTSKTPSVRNITSLYENAVAVCTVDYIDKLQEELRSTQRLDFDEIFFIAKSFAYTGRDREAVKLGIALLGMFSEMPDGSSPVSLRDLFETLGSHDEFTLFAAVALRNTLAQPDRSLWRLAKSVNGWGRIELVDRLAETTDTEIQAWLLREGYKNGVMYEYTALTCANTGNLLQAICQDDVDPALISGGVSIIATLIDGEGGPAEGITDYEHSKNVILKLVEIFDQDKVEFHHLQDLTSIRKYLRRKSFEADRVEKGWTTEEIKRALKSLSRMLDPEKWQNIAVKALSDIGNPTFYSAAYTAETIGIDAWPYRFERQKRGIGDEWWFLMQTDDPKRVEMVLDLARDLIPEAIGGPSFYDPEKPYKMDPMSSILQELRKFPGLGTDLLLIGLDSINPRNHAMAVKAFQEWGQQHFPEGNEKRIAAEIARMDEEEKA